MKLSEDKINTKKRTNYKVFNIIDNETGETILITLRKDSNQAISEFRREVKKLQEEKTCSSINVTLNFIGIYDTEKGELIPTDKKEMDTIKYEAEEEEETCNSTQE